MSLIKYYAVNRRGRTFVVGDIHGCYDQLMALLLAVGFDYENDVLYSTGDICDRGRNSRKCLSLIDKPWFRAVRGNHEELLIKADEDPTFDWRHWISHGGSWAARIPQRDVTYWADKVRQLPVVIVVGEGAERFNVFHAEFHGDDAKLDALAGRKYAPVYLQWGRDLMEGKVKPELHAGLSPSFVGHTIVQQPSMIGSHIYIDTGSYFAERPSPGQYGISLVEPATQQVWKYQSHGVIRL